MGRMVSSQERSQRDQRVRCARAVRWGLTHSCVTPVPDVAGHALQVLCGNSAVPRHWMQKKKADGHAICYPCRKAARVATKEAAATVSTVQRRAPRKPKPYDECARSERSRRRKRGLDALAAIGIPVQALKRRLVEISAVAVVHLPKATRTRVKTIQGLHIPGERAVVAAKLQLAKTHGAETSVFSGGAFVTDPIKLVRVATAGRTHLIVGGDGGGGFLKLGVTYVGVDDVAQFICLLVAEADETKESLQRFKQAGLTALVGESAAHSNMWAVLQHFIDSEGAFLNGDWKFISTVIGHMGASSNYPCFICTAPRNKLVRRKFPHRKRSAAAADMNGMYPGEPLLTCMPTRLVPTPLHVFLGIGDRILSKFYAKTFSDGCMKRAMEPVKSVHAPGNGGLSDFYKLNGNELKKWIKQNCSKKLFDSNGELFVGLRERLDRSARWLEKLGKYLLDSKTWDSVELFMFKRLINEIHAHWSSTTNDSAFPKLHMLTHCLDFAKTHKFLGRVSESFIESYHAQFNQLFHGTHLNLSNKRDERMRRCLADCCLRAVGPKATAETTQRQLAQGSATPRITRSLSATST